MNGNWQRKISPNMSVEGVVDGVVWRVVAQELLIGPGPPFLVIGQFIRKYNNACFAGLGQLGRRLGWNLKNSTTVQLGGKLTSIW